MRRRTKTRDIEAGNTKCWLMGEEEVEELLMESPASTLEVGHSTIAIVLNNFHAASAAGNTWHVPEPNVLSQSAELIFIP